MSVASVEIWKRIALQLEFALAFCVPLMFVAYGAAFGPFLLVAGVAGGDYGSSLAIVVATVGGLLGLSAALQLLFRQVYPGAAVAPPRKLLGRVCAGAIGVATFVPMFSELPWFIGVAMLLPVPVVAHLMYLNRSYLFR